MAMLDKQSGSKGTSRLLLSIEPNDTPYSRTVTVRAVTADSPYRSATHVTRQTGIAVLADSEGIYLMESDGLFLQAYE